MKTRMILNKLQLKAIVNEEWTDITFVKTNHNRYSMFGIVKGKKVCLGVYFPKYEKKFIETILKGMEF